MIDLAGKRALVTGAGKRVGAAIARELGARGMQVAVHYHGSRSGADQTCETIRANGGQATAFQADLYDRGDARRLVREVLTHMGGLDLLVASAANFDRVDFDDVEDGAWDRALSLNLSAPFWLAHEAREALRDAKGSIVFITCTSATKPYKNYLPYVVSKGALQKLTRALALELAPEVRVNAVAPGTVLPPSDLSVQETAALAQRVPLKRLGSPEDVARAVVFAARSSALTGAELWVDGGRLGAGEPGEGAL